MSIIQHMYVILCEIVTSINLNSHVYIWLIYEIHVPQVHVLNEIYGQKGILFRIIPYISLVNTSALWADTLDDCRSQLARLRFPSTQLENVSCIGISLLYETFNYDIRQRLSYCNLIMKISFYQHLVLKNKKGVVYINSLYNNCYSYKL